MSTTVRVEPRGVVVGMAAWLLLSGCGLTAPSRYAEFAEAGRIYVAVFDTLAEHSAQIAVETDDIQLEQARPDLPADRRVVRLTEQNDLLRERLLLLGDIQKHAQLLDDYFRELAALASSDAPVVAGAAAAQLGDSLASLGARLSKRSLGEASISAFLKPVAEVLVSRARSQALARELRERAPVIANELALQEAVLRAISSQLHADLATQAQLREIEAVVRPFKLDGPLPDDWRARRWEALTAATRIPDLDRAISASQKLQRSYRGLVEGQLGRDDLKVLLMDIKRAQAAVVAVRSR